MSAHPPAQAAAKAIGLYKDLTWENVSHSDLSGYSGIMWSDNNGSTRYVCTVSIKYSEYSLIRCNEFVFKEYGGLIEFGAWINWTFIRTCTLYWH